MARPSSFTRYSAFMVNYVIQKKTLLPVNCCSKLWSAKSRQCHTKPPPRSFKVPSFGTLKIVDVLSDVIVEPIEPHENPDADVSFLFGDVDVLISEGNNLEEGLITLGGGKYGDKVTIQVPVQYDLHAKVLGKANFSVSGLEAATVNVQTEEGNATLRSIKAGKIIVASSGGGNINCTSVTQGNIELRTTLKGNITGTRFQGPTVIVVTEDGDVKIESAYSDRSFFRTANGSLTLKNLHRQASVDVSGSGDVNITGLDGSIQANVNNGTVAIQISNLDKDSTVKMNQGSVTLSTPALPKFLLNLKAPEVQVSDELESKAERDLVTIGEPSGPSLTCSVGKGTIRVEKKDWFSSLGLKFK